MSLRDKACYTLTLVPSLADPAVLELVEAHAGADGGAGEARYARVREARDGEVYSCGMYDAYSGARLASAGYVSEKVKSRRLELHGPDVAVPFEFTGRLSFEWTFTFDDNVYHWKREFAVGRDYICTLDRRPDPPVEICLARAGDKNGPGRIQVLHYNLDRFLDDIKDLRGLETLLYTSLICLLDAADERANTLTAKRPALVPQSTSQTSDAKSEDKPPTPEWYEEDANEVVVGVHTDLDAHVARAIGLLEDPNVLFIVIRTKTSSAAHRALEVSLGVTRFRHREGAKELYQYVVEEDDADPPPAVPKSPRVIDLNDKPQPAPPVPAKPKDWQPPKNLAIYLSTIELPDLKPKPTPAGTSARKPTHAPASGTPVVAPAAGTSKLPANAKVRLNPSRPASASGGLGANGDRADEADGRRASSFSKLLRPSWGK
ncbi:hypothetical protein Q5752_000454 [Cryptotrichosporon argae]